MKIDDRDKLKEEAIARFDQLFEAALASSGDEGPDEFPLFLRAHLEGSVPEEKIQRVLQANSETGSMMASAHELIEAGALGAMEGARIVNGLARAGSKQFLEILGSKLYEFVFDAEDVPNGEYLDSSRFCSSFASHKKKELRERIDPRFESQVQAVEESFRVAAADPSPFKEWVFYYSFSEMYRGSDPVSDAGTMEIVCTASSFENENLRSATAGLVGGAALRDGLRASRLKRGSEARLPN